METAELPLGITKPAGAVSMSPPAPCSPMPLRSEREITLAHHAACTCGGAGPGEGCPACEMWHYLFPANSPLTPTPRP
jgi:hypothetical protein